MTVWQYWKPGRRLLRFSHQVYTGIRNTFFTRERKDGRYIRVGAECDRVKEILRRADTAEWYQFSYHYQGEDINRRRPYYNSRDWDFQWHVRGWENEVGGTDLRAHVETDPIKHPREHIDGDMFDEELGMQELKRVLRKNDIRYKEITYDSSV